MLKNKERRDTFLLVCMGVVMVLFVLYLLVPFGKTKKISPAPERPVHRPAKPAGVSVQSENNDYFWLLNQRLESELDRISEVIWNSDQAFTDYPTGTLEEILSIDKTDEKTRDAHPLFFSLLQKARKIGFYDLKDLFQFSFPDFISGRLKFNLFVSLFLLKLKSENVTSEILDFPDALFRRVVTCVPYLAIDNEIDQNYQALPVLFYFQALAGRLNVFPAADTTAFFRNRMADIRDLSPGKWMAGVMELVDFSEDMQPFRIFWKESDFLDPDDTGVYPNLNLATLVFLKQIYQVFPDFENPVSSAWIKKLCEADTGDIELVELEISSEDPGKKIGVEKIFYTPGKSQFIVLLRACDFAGSASMLNRLVSSRMEAFIENFFVVDFRLKYLDPPSFKKGLLQFGHFLKAQIYPLLK